MFVSYVLTSDFQLAAHSRQAEYDDFCEITDNLDKFVFLTDVSSSSNFSKEIYCVSLVRGKQGFCLYENKGADQLCSNCTADQRLCFRYLDSTIPLFLKSEISSF